MTTQMIVQMITTLLFPILTGYAFYLFQILVQKLPLHQRQALEHLSKQAVLSIEQQYKDMSGPDKKLMARELIKSSFKALKIPLLPDFLIDGAIEAVVKQMNQSLTPDPKDLYTQLLEMMSNLKEAK